MVKHRFVCFKQFCVVLEYHAGLNIFDLIKKKSTAIILPFVIDTNSGIFDTQIK